MQCFQIYCWFETSKLLSFSLSNNYNKEAGGKERDRGREKRKGRRGREMKGEAGIYGVNTEGNIHTKGEDEEGEVKGGRRGGRGKG